MTEQQVDREVFFAHVRMIPAADEGEALAEFQQELLHVGQELPLPAALGC